MKKTRISSLPFLGVILLFFMNGCSETSSQVMTGDGQLITRSVLTGLDTPWEILWGPDDHIWITERPGSVSRFNPETGEHEYLLTIDAVHEEGESGLLGMVLHPDFNNSPYVYLVYNYYSGGIKERLVRYTFTGTALTEPMIMLDEISGNRYHIGARLLIDDQQKLFMTTGEVGNTSLAQDLSSLSGKVLRMNLDGSVPDDNPIDGSLIWSWGHRNAQGIVIAPDGKMYSSEHGPNTDDELNIIVKGGNYGWPDVHGFCDSPSENEYCNTHDIIEPLYSWTPTLAVAGIDYYHHDRIAEWQDKILMVNLKESELTVISLDETGDNVTEVITRFDNDFGRLRDILVAPDGRVYLATSNRDGRGNPRSGDDRIVEVDVE